MTTRRVLLILLCLSQFVTTAAAQQDNAEPASEPAAEDPAHNELRELREALTEAVLSGDIDAQIALTDENIVTTWQNNQVARGHDGLKAFLEEMTGDAQDVFQGYTVEPTADDLSILHGGSTAIAFGSSTPHYKYLGMEFDLQNRWTATLVNTNGQWKVAAYHVSGNIADNPILAAAERSLVWAGGVGAAIGLILGLIVGKFLRQRKTVPEPA